ncbi:MAG: helix-turn-helix domain-containing protein, partial [Candidatus Thorarchaeota archaeon]|nr:helix-turn-helix domain-containing protein [Candidatus Thorarchaeota archaeon]
MSEDGKESQSLEEEVFKTLGHQIRRDIIRIIGDNRGLRFTEIMSAINIEESASLSYHLNALGPLLLHDNGLYSLSELGKDTYSLLT